MRLYALMNGGKSLGLANQDLVQAGLATLLLKERNMAEHVAKTRITMNKNEQYTTASRATC